RYVRLFVNGVVRKQAQTDGKGTYTFPTADQYILKATDRVEVVGVSASYQELKRISIPITRIEPTLTVPSHYEIGTNKALSGTFSQEIRYVRLFVNGVVRKQAQTDGKGTYTFPTADQYILKATDRVEVVGVSASYQELKRISIPITRVEPMLTVPSHYEIGTNKALSG
ncbi:hypothetical protein HCJ39_15735, partial [Listeria rocourtiae]|uniref:immunoglobulin-like domain-containing protein n=1 Tax=Listeria rocourtiae TaxID=647910 RepID=UPI0017CDE127|nr:hypothetical protein [Listeria rocourtiae]